MVSSAVWSGYTGVLSTTGCSFITAHTDALNCVFTRDAEKEFQEKEKKSAHQRDGIAARRTSVRTRPIFISSVLSRFNSVSSGASHKRRVSAVNCCCRCCYFSRLADNDTVREPHERRASFTFCASFAYCQRTSASSSVRLGWPSYGFVWNIELFDNDEAISAYKRYGVINALLVEMRGRGKTRRLRLPRRVGAHKRVF